MNYIVLDLEFNQSFPFKSGRKVEPNPECPFEIIQIGAVKLNEAFEQIDTFNALIRPQIYPRLHPFVEKITGIHADVLADKPDFKDAYNGFLKFIGEEPAILCTWGGDDIKSLFRNILFYDLDADALKAILPLMRAGKIPAMSEPTMMKDYRFEIDGIYDNKPLHIVLGENGVSCVYRSGNPRKLQNPESWIAVMEELAEH